MTSHYAKVHDTTIREAFDRYQSQRVNISGQRIGYDPDARTASAEWVKHNLNRVRDSLPNGYCARPAQQDCPHPNACLTCTFIGQFDEAVAHREWARPFEATADGVSDWVVTLDTLAMYCHTYLGHFSEARQLAENPALKGVDAVPARHIVKSVRPLSLRPGPDGVCL